jgi:hypothetical protein
MMPIHLQKAESMVWNQVSAEGPVCQVAVAIRPERAVAC